MSHHGKFRLGAFVGIVLLVGLQRSSVAQSSAPADIRAVLEGTWTLEEWHAEGEIMRPPKMTGRWMVHDGVVMAVRHFDGPKSFESTGAWGAYRITATEWIYGYERSEDATGPTAAEAKLRVRVTLPVPMQAWKIRREGSKLILDSENSLRWEFDGPWLTLYAASGQIIRKYRKVMARPAAPFRQRPDVLIRAPFVSM
jgi:hypothetical protein